MRLLNPTSQALREALHKPNRTLLGRVDTSGIHFWTDDSARTTEHANFVAQSDAAGHIFFTGPQAGHRYLKPLRRRCESAPRRDPSHGASPTGGSTTPAPAGDLEIVERRTKLKGRRAYRKAHRPRVQEGAYPEPQIAANQISFQVANDRGWCTVKDQIMQFSHLPVIDDPDELFALLTGAADEASGTVWFDFDPASENAVADALGELLVNGDVRVLNGYYTFAEVRDAGVTPDDLEIHRDRPSEDEIVLPYRGGIDRVSESIVDQAKKEPITDIGQISDADKRLLRKAVQAGVLHATKAGPFPALKNVYHAPGHDALAARRAFIKHVTSIPQQPVSESEVVDPAQAEADLAMLWEKFIYDTDLEISEFANWVRDTYPQYSPLVHAPLTEARTQLYTVPHAVREAVKAGIHEARSKRIGRAGADMSFKLLAQTQVGVPILEEVCRYAGRHPRDAGNTEWLLGGGKHGVKWATGVLERIAGLASVDSPH